VTVGKQISIVGGHGQIARILSRKLVERGHAVRGLVRSQDQFDDLRNDGSEPELCDVEAAGESDIDEALAGSDVVVFAAGAGPDSGPERKRSLDRDGAVKSVESAVRIGAERFVIVSSMGADDPPDASDDNDSFSVYLRAKHDADAAARAASDRSDLEYTIVRPGKLTDDEATGTVQLAEHADRAEIPRSDVAEVLAELIHSGSGKGATFEVVSGSTAIADAVRSLG
jgi:nucleoside-diphosphate-sugar epimerase